MKKWLKSVICETREQCMDALFTVDLPTIASLTKKEKEKKKRKTQITKHKHQINLNPNGYLQRNDDSKMA